MPAAAVRTPQTNDWRECANPQPLQQEEKQEGDVEERGLVECLPT